MISPREHFLDEQKALACIHCGLCLSSCPTYLETGNENDSPRGRIYLMRAIQDGRLPLEDASVKHIDLCLGCRACERACPSGVRYGELLEHTRDHIEQHHPRSWFQWFLRRFAIEQIFPYPWRLRLTLLPARFLKVTGISKLMPRIIREALELIPNDFSTGYLPEISSASTDERRGAVGLIEGCVMPVMFSKTNFATARLINRAGHDALTPSKQVCCGALYAHSGQLEKARHCARQNIEVFDQLNVDAIVVNAAGCGSILKEYGQLLCDDPDWKDRAIRFSSKVRDLTEWLATFQPQQSPSPNYSKSKTTYHDACHLAHPQGITEIPRTLVKSVSGANYVELSEADVCCGSAGTYNLTEPEMAARLQRRKIENIIKTGAEIVVTTNPGCLLQIQAGLISAGATHVKAMHIADYLESSR